MRVSKELQLAGLSIGIGIFIAAGLFITIGANYPQPAIIRAPGPLPSSITEPAEKLGRAFAAVANYVKPAVVSVYSEKMVRMHPPEFQSPFGDDFFNRFFGQQFRQPGTPRDYMVPRQGMGTGMILDKQGHILTNYHVVADVDKIKVQLPDKRAYEAKIIGADRKTDVAVLEMKGDFPDNLPVVHLGDSDTLEDGNLVMAIGAPFGLTQTVTTGIISATGRSNVGIADYEDFLQTDAPINPGNSGGPLINMRGEVIGMNSAIETSVGQSAGVGFAIPVNMIRAMLPTLMKGEQITRGVLGISIQDVTKDLAEQFKLPNQNGALVAQVSKNSPAEKAGLKPGDVIVRFNGKDVGNGGQLRNYVAGTAPGTSVKIVVIRNGREETLRATIGKMAAEPVAQPQPPGMQRDQLSTLGIAAETLDAELARQLGTSERKGVVITGVAPGSIADAANLQPGDLIVEADHKPVASVEDLQTILNRGGSQLLLLIKRGEGSVFLVLKLR